VAVVAFRLHDLRHFMATTMLAAGVPVPVVSERLCHARTTTTVNIYAHATPGGERAAVNLLAELLTLGYVYRPYVEGAITTLNSVNELGDPHASVNAIEVFIREPASASVQHQALTVSFAASLQEATVRADGPPRQGDESDPRNAVPVPPALATAIEIGQHAGLLREYPPAFEAATQMTNLLFLRSFTRPRESADERAEIILTVLFGSLAPELLVSLGYEARPFRRPPSVNVRRDRKKGAAAGGSLADMVQLSRHELHDR
jgi:hypothetical protein